MGKLEGQICLPPRKKNQLTTTKSEDAGVEKVVASFCFYWPTPHMKQDTVTLARNEPEKA